MPPLISFILRRLLVIPVLLVIITMVIYAGAMLTPPDVRAMLYFPETNAHMTEEQMQHLIDLIIERYHLDEPYLVQYGYWAGSLVRGEWGYSAALNDDVLAGLLQRTPATLELTLFSALGFVPLGLVSGVMAGWKPRGKLDNIVRFLAFISTSVPPFILAMMLLTIFYVNLGWFAPGRLTESLSYTLTPETFHKYTGMYTIDGLLNNRFDVSLDSLRHLVLPAFTLSLFHWATLARVTRATVIFERTRDYITSARARGIPEKRIMWRYAFRNAIAPSFTSLALSAASLVTGVFVVEIIYHINGVSDVITRAMDGITDVPAALGFSIYSVIMVMGMMFLLDVGQAMIDPRVSREVIK